MMEGLGVTFHLAPRELTTLVQVTMRLSFRTWMSWPLKALQAFLLALAFRLI